MLQAFRHIATALLAAAPFLTAGAQTTDWKGLPEAGPAWVTNVSRPHVPTEGLEGRHLALWASHGRYYDQKDSVWKWQRPPLYATSEDLFTQTIVVPYLMPMLERAGAVCFTPRERDWQRHEVIVDNDTPCPSQEEGGASYSEEDGTHGWLTAAQSGFAFHEGEYVEGENPFEAGTLRCAATQQGAGGLSRIVWRPQVPQAGRYAVYVSYATLPGSIPDAHYTVWHRGEKTEFRVNQRMGGSTWVYLGTFDFDATEGDEHMAAVVLTNQSRHEGVVTADAVRFGGGMGNMERGGAVSHLPRCLEGARYWAQWAGMPCEVYSATDGADDYRDDINARSLMTNLLCGGSPYAPDSVGRNVPIELSLAVHSDAGYTPDGTGTYGTLTICTTRQGDATLASGRSRTMSAQLAQRLFDNIPDDLARTYNIIWERRKVYDRNYSETRLPVVPSAIIETMSHQHFGDMRYGHDPHFRFTLARAIYKTILRYVAEKHGCRATVSPLAPSHFALHFTSQQGTVELSWQPTPDPLEPTAAATSYVLYTAIDKGGFDNGRMVTENHLTLKLQPGRLYSFRIAAANKGGESEPTQVLCAYYNPDARHRALLIDGFSRLAAPQVVEQGFDLDADLGVADGGTYGWMGRQRVFDASRIGIEDSTGQGFSTSELAGTYVPGNTHDHLRSHANAIAAAGLCSFVSCAAEAYKEGDYDMIDLCLGLQRDDGYSLIREKAFPAEMQQQLRRQVARGTALLVSGAYVGTDLSAAGDEAFANEVLKCSPSGDIGPLGGESIRGMGTTFTFHRLINEQHYAATHTDRLDAVGGGFSAMAYESDNTSAAVAYAGSDYRTFTMGFPLECIKDETMRNAIVRGIVRFLIERQ